MCPVCSNTGKSSYEVELLDELTRIVDTTYIVSDKSILGNLELDILMPEYKIAIEINGLYWHSEEAGKGKFYHSYKTNKCRDAGIQLIHIFEDEWLYKKDICINRLRSKLGLCNVEYARKFEIRSITNLDAYNFLSKYHIQGRGTAAAFCYGLFKGADIHAVMTFSKLSIAKGSTHVEGKYELNRYASIDNIVGGASKLFSYFIKAVNPTEIISYSDERWNTGNLYNTLGFIKTGITQPNYWYIKNKNFNDWNIKAFKKDNWTQNDIDICKKMLLNNNTYDEIANTINNVIRKIFFIEQIYRKSMPIMLALQNLSECFFIVVWQGI